MEKLHWKILNAIRIGGPIQLMINSQLRDDGWFKSFYSKQSIDFNNKPIPWYRYSFIKFLEPRLKKTFNVFEYGSGNSTLWFAQRVKKIKAVEHNKNWFEKISKLLPENAGIAFKEIDNGEYASEVKSGNEKYDIIIIDGVDRNNCVYKSLECLSDKGIYIYDNSERKEYEESKKFLTDNEFKQIDFHGLGPVVPITSCTSVFYRESNCLKI